ncbi:MAG: hypothetical protein CMJ44_01190 [Pimelobacter sp.]|nr:hypothetical protein [Pimelobacter sp.]
MTRVVGRSTLLAQVAGLLEQGESLALCGPTGVGKSALLDVLEETARTGSDRRLVLRCTGSAEERVLPFAAVRDLLAQGPDPSEDPGCSLEPLDLERFIAADDRAGLAAAVHAVLEHWSRSRRLLLLLDDVQWLDAESSAIVGYARRRLRGRLSVVVTLGGGDQDAADTLPQGLSTAPPRRSGAASPGGDEIDVSGLHHLDVTPLDPRDLVDLLLELGVTPDVAQRISVESGGMPSSALAFAGAIGQRPQVLGSPTPVPPSIAHVLRERVLSLPEAVRATLVHAALLHRPTVRQLQRGGRLAADDDVRRALGAGLLAGHDRAGGPGGSLRFTPSVLRSIVVGLLPAHQRAELHRELAETASTDPERLRHLALSDPRPDADLAHELADGARDAAAHGGRELAAELYLLAADRAPASLNDERLEWLVQAVETAAPGNHVDLVQRALAQAFDELDPGPAQRVRLRLAIPELAGNGVALLDEVLTAAAADAAAAGDVDGHDAADEALVAQVLLQRARIALMESRPRASREAAERAVEILERTGPAADDGAVALALTTLAVSRRWLGVEHASYLQRAVELAEPTTTGFLHISPGYMAARFAFYDDRLDEARSAFLTMLGRVERGAGMDHVHVLRCLVEVAARTGRCAEATRYAGRAAAVGAEFDIDAYAGWFIGAQAELLVGDLGRTRTLALRGAQAAEEAGDIRYLQRHLVVLGQALLRSGDAEGAVTALTRVRDIEVEGGFGDPTVNRWHADLVSALVALGRLDEAGERLAEARYAVERRASYGGTSGVTAQVDRAEAELSVARGDLETAEVLLDRAAKITTDLGLRIDLGRTHVARAHLERRRRRAAASRTALQQAHDLFVTLGATSWAGQVLAELSPDRAAVPAAVGAAGEQAAGLLARLSETEARIARAVASGASNREIAERSYVSVKTVEATLTRIYRKLDIRSRTRLAALLAPRD